MPRTSDARGPESSPAPAWRVSSSCPTCGNELVIRTNRIDGSCFLACSAFPRCRFREGLDELISTLVERVADLEAEVAEIETELRAERAVAVAMPARVVAKELRDLIYRWHPDRRRDPIPPHEVVAELTRIRAQAS